MNPTQRDRKVPASPARCSKPAVRSIAATIEPLEGRALLASFDLSGGLLTVTLDNGRTNNLYIRANSTNTSYLSTLNGADTSYAKSSVTAIRVIGGDQSDVIDISRSVSVPTTLQGGAGNDTIKGGNGNDLIFAGDGNDTVYARDGADVVRGSAGNDKLFGGDLSDRLYGDAGTDSLYGENGDDLLDAGGGRIDGGAGNDTGINASSYLSVEKGAAIVAPPAEPTASGTGTVPAPTPTPTPAPSPAPAPTPTPTDPSGSTPTGGTIVNGTYNIYDGLGINEGKPVSSMIPILRDLGVQRVRVVYSTSSWDNRGFNKWAANRAIEFKKAGFHVLMLVYSRSDVDVTPTADKVRAYFSWLINQPGMRNAAHLWQIGNEVNHNKFFKGTLKAYVENLLKPASEVLRAAGQKVVGGGINWNPNDVTLAVKYGYNNYVDYAAFHPYGSSPAQVLERARAAVANFAGKKVLFTEWNIRDTPNLSEWAREVVETREGLKKLGEGAYYYALYVSNSMAGPAGLVNTNGTRHEPFYTNFRNWKFDKTTQGNLFR